MPTIPKHLMNIHVGDVRYETIIACGGPVIMAGPGDSDRYVRATKPDGSYAGQYRRDYWVEMPTEYTEHYFSRLSIAAAKILADVHHSGLIINISNAMHAVDRNTMLKGVGILVQYLKQQQPDVPPLESKSPTYVPDKLRDKLNDLDELIQVIYEDDGTDDVAQNARNLMDDIQTMINA